MALNLIGKIELDGAGFERGLRRAGGQVTDFAKHAAVAAFGFYGVEEAIRKTVETASDLVDSAQRLDVTVEQLQLLKQAAKDAGSDMGALAGAFEKINIARAKALGGDKSALSTFAKLGVSNDQLKNQRAATIFTTSIASATQNRSAEDIGPVLREIFGKGFGELIPVLKTDFEDLRRRMETFGKIIDTDTAVKLDAVGDSFSLLSTIITGELAPVILSVVELLIMLTAKLHATGVGLEQLFNGNGGGPKNWLQGAGSLGKFVNDSLINLVPGKVGDKLQDASDAYYKAIFKISPKDALNNVMDAADAFNTDDKEQQDKIDALKAQLKAAADAIKNPKPRAAIIDAAAPEAVGKRFGSLPSDALIKVGNFLGSNGQTIERVNQQKLSLMREQVQLLRKLEQKAPSGGMGNFGMGIPTV